MSEYYNAQRKKNLYVTGEPFKLSRSKIENFMNCRRCFWLDRVKGIGQPPGYPFSLNVAVDSLLKKEFDSYRSAGKPHPLMAAAGLDGMIPFAHPKMNEWRENFKGVQHTHKKTGLIITGAVDDLWAVGKEISIVDYKATSKKDDVSLDAEWQDGYKRQMEIYQWLMRQEGFKVSDTGYFVYCNGIADRDSFDAQLHFKISILPYTGDDSWVEDMIMEIKMCLDSGVIPKASDDCDFCAYHAARGPHS